MSTLLFLLACGGSDPSETTPSTPEPAATTDLGTLPGGVYQVGLSIASVGGLVVPFQLTLDTIATADGPRFATFELRALDGEATSDVRVSVADVPVDADGGFVAELPAFTLPAAFSVTGSAVDVEASFLAEAGSPEGFCGTVSGQLVTFGLDLAGSTFGAVRWEDRVEAPPTGCSQGNGDVPRISDCPTLVAGGNTMTSGGQDRTFEVVLPADYPAAAPYPMALVFHGIGGTAQDMLSPELLALADERDVILVVPQGEDLGGEAGWDAFSPPGTNLDAVLFDDLVTCASESFDVDPERIHVTGMSNGGLLTGYLIATRNDVVASAAPLSGGIGVEWDDSGRDMPVLVTWGGESDFAFEQDFDLLAAEMIAECQDKGFFVAACDHGTGHSLDPAWWPWVFEFLLDHPYTLAAEPYAAGLPASFPAFCSIP